MNQPEKKFWLPNFRIKLDVPEIQERNLKSDSFEQLAKVVTGRETNHGERVLAYGLDSFSSSNLYLRVLVIFVAIVPPCAIAIL